MQLNIRKNVKNKVYRYLRRRRRRRKK